MTSTQNHNHPTCIRCERPITSARSIRESERTGIYAGRHCRTILNRVAGQITRIFKPWQVRKAADLLKSGAVAHYAGDTYRVVSEKVDGKTGVKITDVYYTNVRECSCKAGSNGIRCYHRATIYMIVMAEIRSLLGK